MSTGNVHRPVLIMARALKDHPYTFVGIANLEPGTFIRNDGGITWARKHVAASLC